MLPERCRPKSTCWSAVAWQRVNQSPDDDGLTNPLVLRLLIRYACTMRGCRWVFDSRRYGHYPHFLRRCPSLKVTLHPSDHQEPNGIWPVCVRARRHGNLEDGRIHGYVPTSTLGTHTHTHTHTHFKNLSLLQTRRHDRPKSSR